MGGGKNGGRGGGGAAGFFGMGKANVTSIDQKAKDKVCPCGCVVSWLSGGAAWWAAAGRPPFGACDTRHSSLLALHSHTA
jgi:hypothetical protein